MGQKCNPIGLRLGITRTWTSKWCAESPEYAVLLEEDLRIRKLVKERLKHAGISQIEIERSSQKVKVTIHAARPGIIIGRRGETADQLKNELVKRTGREITVNIKEVKRPEIDAQLISENIASQLERRIAFRRAIRRTLAQVRFGANLHRAIRDLLQRYPSLRKVRVTLTR